MFKVDERGIFLRSRSIKFLRLRSKSKIYLARAHLAFLIVLKILGKIVKIRYFYERSYGTDSHIFREFKVFNCII